MRKVALVAMVLGLAGCDGQRELLLGGMQHDVTVLDEPATLGSTPTRLEPREPLMVAGLTTDLCVGLADGVAQDADLGAELLRVAEGASVSAVLYADDGKRYAWTCNGASLRTTGAQTGRLAMCLGSDCNAGPAVGSVVMSIDLKSDRPLRILDVTWMSTASFDHVYQPPKDNRTQASEEYRDLERSFAGPQAWDSPADVALRLWLGSNRRSRSSSDFNSTLLFRLGDEGVQLQPADPESGLQIVIIPVGAIHACTMSSFGARARYAELLLPEQGLLLGFLNAPKVVDWCWQHRIPMATGAARRAWLYDGTPLPAKDTYATQLQSHDAYYEQANRSAAGW